MDVGYHGAGEGRREEGSPPALRRNPACIPLAYLDSLGHLHHLASTHLLHSDAVTTKGGEGVRAFLPSHTTHQQTSHPHAHIPTPIPAPWPPPVHRWGRGRGVIRTASPSSRRVRSAGPLVDALLVSEGSARLRRWRRRAQEEAVKEERKEEEKEEEKKEEEEEEEEKEEENQRASGGGEEGAAASVGKEKATVKNQAGATAGDGRRRGACRDGWVEEDGRCFRLVEEVASWAEAELACAGEAAGEEEDAAGHLAAVTSHAVARLLERLINER
ncbi:hypothetical protein O3P69_020100 [Scylla paramamosain]|uniref:Uncharacterized protein n=1 Tax=Scylla paramamosain TaxID=85552 RepID=A0AAW0TJW3_SCYPA